MRALGLAIFIISIIGLVLTVIGFIFQLIRLIKTGEIDFRISCNIILMVLAIIFMSMFLWA